MTKKDTISFEMPVAKLRAAMTEQVMEFVHSYSNGDWPDDLYEDFDDMVGKRFLKAVSDLPDEVFTKLAMKKLKSL